MPKQETAQIFLSYASEDRDKVENLYQKLSEAGFKPWMDRKDILPGEKWKKKIPTELHKSDLVLVCLSSTSVKKRGYFQREIREALDAGKEMVPGDIYLIPARLEDCEVPDDLSGYQWVDLFEEDGWALLVKAIEEGLKRREEGLKRRQEKEDNDDEKGEDILYEVNDRTSTRPSPHHEGEDNEHWWRPYKTLLSTIMTGARFVIWLPPLVVAFALQVLCPGWTTDIINFFAGTIIILALLLVGLLVDHASIRRRSSIVLMISVMLGALAVIYWVCGRSGAGGFPIVPTEIPSGPYGP